METELVTYKKIKDWPYVISEYGEVFSLFKNKINQISVYKRPSGHHTLRLCKNMGGYTFFVHGLVAQCFLGKKPKRKEVNHKDRNKNNNHFSNLEYVTRKENNDHRRATDFQVRAPYYDPIRKNWQARLGKGGKNIHMGRFKTKAEALNAMREKYKEIYGTCHW